MGAPPRYGQVGERGAAPAPVSRRRDWGRHPLGLEHLPGAALAPPRRRPDTSPALPLHFPVHFLPTSNILAGVTSTRSEETHDRHPEGTTSAPVPCGERRAGPPARQHAHPLVAPGL